MNIVPYFVDIEITTFCNLRCIHCYNSSGENPKHFKKEFLKSIMLELKKKGTVFFDIIGGEVFCYPYIFEIIEFGKKIGLKVMINTNGTLISEKIATKLKEINPEITVGVSLDGSNSSINDFIRGKGNFERTIIGIKNLKKLKIDVVLLFVLNKLNWMDFKNYLELAKSLEIKKIYIDRFFPVGRGDRNENLLNLNLQEWKLVLSNINNLIEKNSENFIFFVEPSINGKECPAGKTHFSILIDGSVVPCGHFRNNNEFYLGNLYLQPIDEILKNAKKLFEKQKKENSCNICFGGCRFSSLIYRNSFHSCDPILCPIETEKIKVIS